MTRFSPLCWSVPSTTGFNAKDAQARQLLLELASLQVKSLSHFGNGYLERVREELSGIGVQEPQLGEYLGHLTDGVQREKEKAFKQYYAQFVGSK